MIVINKRTNRFRVKLDVNAKYEDAAKSLRRLQIQPVGSNIASIELNNGVIGLAGADGVHVPLVHGAVIEIDSQHAKDLENPSGVRLGKQSDEGILWELIPGIEGGFVVSPSTLPYTTRPRPESIQKEPFKLWKGLGPNTNRKEHRP